jgi:hypothetical protein
VEEKIYITLKQSLEIQKPYPEYAHTPKITYVSWEKFYAELK